MKPTPNSNPHYMKAYIEKVEEIRVILVQILSVITECCEKETILEYMN